MTKFTKYSVALSTLIALAGCMTPAPEMSPQDQAALSEARAEAISAECALYAGTDITPEGC